MILRPPDHKTKIVCTLGPASRSEEVLEGMIRQGMTVQWPVSILPTARQKGTGKTLDSFAPFQPASTGRV